ncbi:MAG: hypothetical protein EA401_08065 [Planctomycetota bacterium]|nr:MAG: hypothetical protein EA401_08065 [Planctomycetota bacterium]
MPDQDDELDIQDLCDFQGCTVSGADKISHTCDFIIIHVMGQAFRGAAGILRSRCKQHFEPPRRLN